MREREKKVKIKSMKGDVRAYHCGGGDELRTHEHMYKPHIQYIVDIFEINTPCVLKTSNNTYIYEAYKYK